MATDSTTEVRDLKDRQRTPLATPTDLTPEATRDITGCMNAILADVFALYLKTKNFHWHLSGPHFRDYHLMFDEQAAQLFAMTDPIAERVRKIGGSTIRSIGHISRHSASSTTTPITSSPRTCWPNCARTTRRWRRACATPTTLRRAPRRRHRQPDRDVDRRDGAADLVPVRDRPA